MINNLVTKIKLSRTNNVWVITDLKGNEYFSSKDFGEIIEALSSLQV